MKKIIFAFVGLILMSTNSFSQAKDEKNFLQGLKGFYVLAEGLDDNFKKVGLTEIQLETDTGQRLKNAGIYVATREESFKPQIGLLYIIVTAFEPQKYKGLYPYMIQIEVKQEVTLVRKPSIKNMATTYQIRTILGIAGADELKDISRVVGENVDLFIKDYFSVNPK